jgi:hypothetical protein
VAAAWGNQTKESEMLRRTFSGSFGKNIVAMMRRTSSNGRGDQTVKHIRSKAGLSRDVVISPILCAGQETLDDGQKLFKVFPDDKVIYAQPSRHVTQNVDQRVKLAFENYNISSKSGPTTLGRETVLLVASPKRERLATIELLLDKSTGFAMRRTVDYGDEREVEYETQSIEFPESLPATTFKLNVSSKYSLIELSPSRFSGVAEAGRYLGFSAVEPKVFPYGFKIQSVSVRKSSEWNPISIVLSDGLVTLSVYQWKPQGEDPVSTTFPNSAKTKNGIRVIVVGECPRWLRDSVLKVFADSGRTAEDNLSRPAVLVAHRDGN